MIIHIRPRGWLSDWLSHGHSVLPQGMLEGGILGSWIVADAAALKRNQAEADRTREGSDGHGVTSGQGDGGVVRPSQVPTNRGTTRRDPRLLPFAPAVTLTVASVCWAQHEPRHPTSASSRTKSAPRLPCCQRGQSPARRLASESRLEATQESRSVPPERPFRPLRA